MSVSVNSLMSNAQRSVCEIIVFIGCYRMFAKVAKERFNIEWVGCFASREIWTILRLTHAGCRFCLS